MKTFLWGLMALFALGVGGYAIFILASNNIADHPFLGHHFLNRPFAFFGHLGLGALALIIGPFQFLPRLRAFKPNVHKWLGRSYVVFCLVSAVCSFFLVYNSSQDLARYGFALLGVVWFYVTLQAFLKARARNFGAHKDWMIRSYSITFAAVTLRIILPLQLIYGVPFETAYIITSWACWVPNLIFAEWYVRRAQVIKTKFRQD